MTPRRASRSMVIAAARELIDSDGLRGLSMRQVGSRLGVEAMSLYHYVASREALVGAVVDDVVQELQHEVERQPDPLDAWPDYLTDLAYRIRTFAREHPQSFALLVSPADEVWLRPPLRSLAALEAFLVALRRRGLDDTAALYAYRSFTSFLVGHLLLDPAGEPRSAPADHPQHDAPAGHHRLPMSQRRRPTSSAVTAPDLDRQGYPTIAHLAARLEEDHTDRDFALDLHDVLTRLRHTSGTAGTCSAWLPGTNEPATSGRAKDSRLQLFTK